MDTKSSGFFVSHTNTTARIVLVIFFELTRVQSRVRSVKTTIRMNISFVFVFFCIEVHWNYHTEHSTHLFPIIYILLFLNYGPNVKFIFSMVSCIETAIGHPLVPISHSMPCHVAVSLLFFFKRKTNVAKLSYAPLLFRSLQWLRENVSVCTLLYCMHCACVRRTHFSNPIFWMVKMS